MSLSQWEHVIAENGTYIFNVKNIETGEVKKGQVIVDSITGNYKLGTHLERVEAKVERRISKSKL